MGAYGLVRINMELLSHAHSIFSPGTGYDRLRLLYLDQMGGMAIPMPKIFTVFSILSMASLALPGMSGFVVELMIFFGILTSQKYLLMNELSFGFISSVNYIG
ncbi:hypothetical protein Ahy_A03g013507 isoform C [Arachis hypogaea]|uniref:NADH:quinone oxidoreductase/Mrp antiporter transmembrane domain-containing protein n=1 Tax=Arachis hypogaea TaxID=3818 RepID=A0A445DVT7_ARAHY|nr:hypothetical protein Ahy_A03g013507 isoform C [Arachis hypogaea]